jgi:hypothetical protein
MNKLFAFLFILLSVAVADKSTAQINPAMPLPQDGKLIKGKLENGLTYYIREIVLPQLS